MSQKENKGTNPLIHTEDKETLDATCDFAAHVAESLESDPEKRGVLFSVQLLVEALQHLKLDRLSDQCHTHEQ